MVELGSDTVRWNYEYPKPGDPAYTRPQPWKAYTDALHILFRIEATLRVFVYAVLKAEFRDKWMTEPKVPDFVPTGASDQDAAELTGARLDNDEVSDSERPASDGSTSKAKTARSIDRTAKRSLGIRSGYEFVDPRPQCPLQELTLRELLGLIETQRKSFGPFFAGFDRARLRLREIAELRNRFAHFRPMRPEDIVRLMRNAQDALGTAEDYVGALLTFGTKLVPPDIDDAWYHHLRGTLDRSLNPRFFLHGMRVPGRRENIECQWVTLQIEHRTVALETATVYPGRKKYLVPSLHTPRILHTHPALSAFAVCLREGHLSDDQHWYATWDEAHKCYVFGKRVCLTFPLSALRSEEAYEPLAIALSGLSIHLLSEEQSLRRNRHNKTALLEPTHIDDDDLTGEGEVFAPWSCALVAPQADDPVEYWGDIWGPRQHFITDADEIPWVGRIG